MRKLRKLLFGPSSKEQQELMIKNHSEATAKDPELFNRMTEYFFPESKSISDSSVRLEHLAGNESPSDRFERLQSKFLEDSRIQSVLKLNFDTHNPPKIVEEFFQEQAAIWIQDATEEFVANKSSHALFSLMRLGWTIAQELIESRGGLVLSFDQGPIESGIERTTPTSAEEWKEIVESEWADWKSFPDMRYLSDEAFYCLFTLQNFREVTTFLDVDSIKEEKSSELESVLDTAKCALLYGVVCLVALRDFGSHRYLETPEIVEW